MLEWNSRGFATISKNPQCPSAFQTQLNACTDSTVTLRTDSKQDGSCDSPVAPREKATDPYGQTERKPDTAFLAREESRLAWLQKGRSLNPLWTPQGNPEVHVSPGEET